MQLTDTDKHTTQLIEIKAMGIPIHGHLECCEHLSIYFSDKMEGVG